MAVSSGDITGRFPEFSTVPPERLAFAISDATAQVNAGAFGDKTDLAIIYLSAHLLAVGNLGSGGKIQSEKVGDIARTYAAPPAGESELGSTAYGSAFLNLRRQVVGPMVL